MFWHEPVLLDEVLELLDPKAGDKIIDCTIGGGGHAFELLKRTGKSGKLLGIDLDPHAVEEIKNRAARQGFEKQITIIEEHFKNLEEIAPKHGFEKVNIIFFDLGLSSHLIEDPSHGLSFQTEALLDMRFGPRSGELTALDIVNTYSEDEIAGLLLRYGGERRARQIAKAICQKRRAKKITTTKELACLAAAMYGFRKGGIHPATRTFQALRVTVNDELSGLRQALFACPKILEIGGRLGVISYHSGEDRIAKRAFVSFVRELGWKLIVKKVVRPKESEIKQNPRARSAKLRVILCQRLKTNRHHGAPTH